MRTLLAQLQETANSTGLADLFKAVTIGAGIYVAYLTIQLVVGAA